MHRAWRGNLALLLTVSGLTLFITIGIGEWAVRRREETRVTVPGNMPFLHYRHDRLRYAMVRNSSYYDWVHVESHGFRGTEVALVKQPGTTRVLVIGGSTAFDGMVTRDAQAWPVRLEHWLRTLARDRPVEVINAGVSGYQTLDNLIRFQTELYAFAPDILIVYEGHNDILATLSGRVGTPPAADRPGEIEPRAPWTHWLEQHSLLYNKVVLRMKALASNRRALGSSGVSAEGVRQLIEAGATRFERDLNALVLIAQGSGARVLVPQLVHVSGAGSLTEEASTVRAEWQRTLPASPDAVLHAYAAFDSVARVVARRQRATYVSTSGFDLKGPEWYAEGDPIHFNDRGADRMGQKMAEALLASGVVGTPFGPAPRVRQ